MSKELLYMEFLECDLVENAQLKKRRLSMRKLSDPFELGDLEFIRRYRLSKELTLNLCDELRPMLKEPKRSTDLDLETKVLTTLSFYAVGSYQRPIGDISAHSLAQQTVSSVVAQITTCLNSPYMRRKYIAFPSTLEERNATRSLFFSKFGMPGVLGCVDGTLIPIIRPSEHEERYYCRKQFHSLNVQLICDANMQITSIDASFGGATHDSFIWNSHPIKTFLEGLNEATWLLGDSGYPLRRYMMTPITNAAEGTPENLYTNTHVRTRNVVERTLGVLKSRFRCLNGHRVLNLSPEVAASVVNACAILHNICNKAKLPILDLGPLPGIRNRRLQRAAAQPEDPADSVEVETNRNNPQLRIGTATRQRLVQRLWESRSSL